MKAPTLILISPTATSNALGRATCLADLATAAGFRTRLLAPYDGPLWPAAERAAVLVERVSSPARAVELLATEPDGSVLWNVKPITASWKLTAAIRTRRSGFRCILDVDDDEAGLAAEFIAALRRNRLTLNRFRSLHPRRTDKVLADALAEVDGVTYATEALRAACPTDSRQLPTLIVPHPRSSAVEAVPFHRGETIGIAFLGTIREHKGLQDVIAVLAQAPLVRLHVFSAPGAERLLRPVLPQVVWHPPAAPFEAVFSEVDLVVIPQRRSPAADVQLPAKLLDAMRYGRAVLASPTPAIIEAAGNSVDYVERWTDTDTVWAQIRRTHERRHERGAAARERFISALALERQIGPLGEFVSVLAA